MMLKSIDKKQLSLLNNLKPNRAWSFVCAKASCQGWASVGHDYFGCCVIGSESFNSLICQVTAGNLNKCFSLCF